MTSAQALQEQLQGLLGSLAGITPLVVLALALVLVVVTDLAFKKRWPQATGIVALLGFIVPLFWWWPGLGPQSTQSLFQGMVVLSPLSHIMQFVICLGGLGTILLTVLAPPQERSLHFKGEFYALVYGLILGACLLASTTHLLLIYLSIELLSICAYLLTTLGGQKQHAEAGLKYFLFGATTGAIMLFGMSWLYGFTGSLNMASPVFIKGILDSTVEVTAVPLFIAMLLVLAGLLYKMASAPLHYYVPDVYQGAPTPVVALISTVPKLATLALLIQILAALRNASIIYIGMQLNWGLLLGVVGLLTLLVGNLGALRQVNAKRLLAYSAVAQIGFMLLAVAAGTNAGVRAALFYSVVYLVMNFAAFLLVQYTQRFTGSQNIKQYSGLGRQLPWLGIMWAVVLLALTGLPPTAGFMGKLLVFTALLESYQLEQNPLVLALVLGGLFNTVIALFYYIKIPYYLFFKPAPGKNSPGLTQTPVHTTFMVAAGTLLVLPLLIWFFAGGWLASLFQHIEFIL